MELAKGIVNDVEQAGEKLVTAAEASGEADLAALVKAVLANAAGYKVVFTVSLEPK
jgi:hypothetical protein